MSYGTDDPQPVTEKELQELIEQEAAQPDRVRQGNPLSDGDVYALQEMTERALRATNRLARGDRE